MATIRRREGRNGAVTWQVVLSVIGPDGQRARPSRALPASATRRVGEAYGGVER